MQDTEGRLEQASRSSKQSLRSIAVEDRERATFLNKEQYRRNIDADLGFSGNYPPTQPGNKKIEAGSSKPYPQTSTKDGEINIATAVKRGEYTWIVRGMSWLKDAMEDQ